VGPTLFQLGQDSFLIFDDGVQGGLILQDGGLVLLNDFLIGGDGFLVGEDGLLVLQDLFLIADYVLFGHVAE
jgi:hypothetical protein